MTTKEAIEKIWSPKGVTSVISGILNDDFSVLNNQKGIEASLLRAKEMVKKYKKDIDECQSDWSYWSILGDLEYWKAVEMIFKAGMIHNGELADVDAPDLQNCVVMDAISKVSEYGEKVLKDTTEKFKQ